MQTKHDNIYDAIVLGAGFAGIGAAIKLKQAGIENFIVLEKNSEVGGTWLENSYPGAACDVPSHFYCYSFNPNPSWSRKFAPQDEIREYIDNTADKFDVKNNIRFNTLLKRFVLNEELGIWQAELDDGETLLARHILNGMGGLHKANIPEFSGLGKFQGPTMHSIKWDHSVDFTNKRVAVIGSAASAIQIIPELQKVCAKVDIYQRTPNFIAPRNDRSFTDKEKQRFERWPIYARLYRWFIYKRMELLVYPLTQQGSRLTAKATERLVKWIRSIISDPELQEKLIPKYTIGCKRILLSDTFYETLRQHNVELISSAIDSIAQHCIITRDGEQHAADVIVFATGFDIQGHQHSIDIVGKDGVSMKELGPDGDVAFKGASHSQFPNFHMITGPNTGVGTSSVVYMIELQLDYILQLIQACKPGQLLSVKADILQQYNESLQNSLARTVWASGCDSWYLRDDGKIVTLYPGNAKSFAKEHKNINLEHFDLVSISTP